MCVLNEWLRYDHRINLGNNFYALGILYRPGWRKGIKQLKLDRWTGNDGLQSCKFARCEGSLLLLRTERDSS